MEWEISILTKPNQTKTEKWWFLFTYLLNFENSNRLLQHTPRLIQLIVQGWVWGNEVILLFQIQMNRVIHPIEEGECFLKVQSLPLDLGPKSYVGLAYNRYISHLQHSIWHFSINALFSHQCLCWVWQYHHSKCEAITIQLRPKYDM